MKKFFLFLLFVPVIHILADDFDVPAGIEQDVEFWKKVYGEWDSHQVVFYDEVAKVVYDTLSLPPVEGQISSPRFKDRVDERLKELSLILKRIDAGVRPDPMSSLYRSVLDIVEKNGNLKAGSLSGRLRYQNGLRSQFELGLRSSERYIRDMEAILAINGLPSDLLVLVFVESLFYISATSHKGASGPWGFVKETAIRSGIHVNNFTDERLDPVLATKAAANFLKRAKLGLEEWPLVITSYNYGYSGMVRAAANLGTKDLKTIIDNHQSPLFGYASKNYYAEFLAARDIFIDHKKYFPNLEKEEPWRYQLVQVLRPVDVQDLKKVGAVDPKWLKSLNPGLSQRTISGHEVIPAQYSLRIPHGTSDRFYERLKRIPSKERRAAGYKISTKHRANGRESISTIAKLFGISADFLAKKMGNKSIGYRPSKGVVIIRSEDHLFSSLEEIQNQMKDWRRQKGQEMADNSDTGTTGADGSK